MAPPSAERRLLYHLSLIGFFAIFSTTISKNPVLPLFAASLGANDETIGLIAAVSPLAGMLFSYPVGALSDRFGRKRLLVSSGIVFVAAPLLYLVVGEPLALIPLRFFHGTATAILGPVIAALIADRFRHSRGQMLGTYSSSTLVGRAAAPLIGGTILSLTAGAPGLLPYHIVYAGAFVAAIPVAVLIFFLDEGGPIVTSAGPIGLKESFAAFIANPILRATALAEMATYFGFGIFETFMPLLMTARGAEAHEIGLIFSLQVIVIAATKPLFGRISDRTGRPGVILAGLLLLGGSIALLPFTNNLIIFTAASVGIGIGMSFSTVATSAYVADVAKTRQLGASMGALSSIMDIGHSSGPFVAGLIIGRYGFAEGFLGASLLAGVIAVYFAASTRHRET